MAKLPNFLCVFDLETSNKYAETTAEPVQIAFKMFDYYSLDEIPGAEWSQTCRPLNVDLIDPESLGIHKIPLQTIMDSPCVKLVWQNFVDEVQKFNPSKTKFNAPIVAGFNIRGFDLKIVARMQKLFYGDKPPVLFNDFRNIDLMDIMFNIFDTSKELPDMKFDSIRDFFGISKSQAHLANMDVRHEGFLLVRLLKFLRQTGKNSMNKFKGAFSKTDFGTVSY